MAVSKDIISTMSIEMLFDYLGILIDPKKSIGLNYTINWNFTDIQQKYGSSLKNTVFIYSNKLNQNPDITLTLTKKTLNQVLSGKTSFKAELDNAKIKIDGKSDILSLIDETIIHFKPTFKLVTP